MAAKACVWFEAPSRDCECIVGDNILLNLKIENCGDVGGGFYSIIRKDGVSCANKYNEFLNTGGVGTMLECSFTMPNKVVTVDFYGGHAEGGVWKEDFHDIVKLTPKVVVEKCTQWVKVVDSYGNAIGGAQVKIENDKTEYKNTLSDGRISFELTEGIRYTATASKSGYECLVCSNNFEACLGERVLTLKKIEETCSQSIRVNTSEGSVLAWVAWGDGRRETFLVPATITHEYEEGKTRTVTVTADGYEGDSKTFTTCIPEFTLTLTKGVKECKDYLTKTECESAGCYWWSGACHRSPEGEEAWKSVGEPYWTDDSTIKVDCEAQNLSAEMYGGSRRYQYTVRTFPKDKTTPRVTGSELTAESPKGYGYWFKDFIESYGNIIDVKLSKYDRKTGTTTYVDSVTRTILPKEETCSQVFYIKDKDTDEELVVDTVSVDSKTVSRVVTAYYVTLTKGQTYTIRATKSGYNSLEQSFTPNCPSSLTFYMIPTCTVTCDLDDCPNTINVKTGCNLLKHYDTDNDGVISQSELLKASNDLSVYGKITKPEMDFIADCWTKGSINAKCPGCYTPTPKKDTTICDFDVLDAEGKKVTDLVAGVRYTVRAWLCKVEGGGCAYKGCDSGCEIEGEELKLFLYGGGELAKGTTNVNGYAHMYWTPSADIVGDNSIRMEFIGSANYNWCESDLKTVSVSADKFEVTITEVPTKGCCVFALHKAFPIPFTDLNFVDWSAWKYLKTDGSVTFTVADGLVVGDEYAIRIGDVTTTYPTVICFYPFSDKKAEFDIFSGVKKKALKGWYEMPGWMQWFCGKFDIPKEECSSAWAGVPAHIVFSPQSWKCVLEGKDLDDKPCTPSKWDYVFMGLDCLVIFPVGAFTKLGGRGAKLSLRVADNADVLPWIEGIGKKRLVQAIAGASEASFKHFDDLLKAGKFSDAEVWVAKYIVTPDWVPKSRAIKELTKQIDNIIGQAKKAGKPAGKIIEESGVGAAHAKAAVQHGTDYADEVGKLRRFFKENVIWDDIVEFDRNIFINLDEYGKVIPGSTKIHPSGIRHLDIYRIEGLAKSGNVAKLKAGGRLDYFLRYATLDISKDPAKFRKIIGVLDDVEADTIVRELKAVGKVNEASLYKGLRTSSKWVKSGGVFDGVKATADDVVDVAKVGTPEAKVAAKGIVDDAVDSIKVTAKDENLIKGIEKSDDIARFPRAKRFWDYVKSVKDEAGRTWKGLTFAQKVKFYLKYIMLYSCFGLFITEETMQWIGFQAIPLSWATRDWEHKSLERKKNAIENLEWWLDIRDDNHTIITYMLVPLTVACPYFAPLYWQFHKMDATGIESYRRAIEDLKKDIDPFTGKGRCYLEIYANVDNVWIGVNGPTGEQATRLRPVEKEVPTFDYAYPIALTGIKDGYMLATQIITINPGDLGATKKYTLEMKLKSNIRDMYPETPVSPFPSMTPTEDDLEMLKILPGAVGGSGDSETFYHGEVHYGGIYCETEPKEGAKIYIKGGKWADWHDTGQITNWTITTIEVGDYYIKFIKTGYKECLANDGAVIEVLKDQTAHAFCTIEEIKPIVEFDWSPPSPEVNEEVTFDATDSKAGTGATITSYTWYCDDVKFGTNSVTATKTFSEGSYRIKLKVTNSYGYSEEKVKVLTVKPPVCPSSTASFVHSPSKPKVGERVTFTSNSTTGSDASLVSWVWDFDDGSYGSGEQVTHTFTAKKIYNVKLTVKNDCCTNARGKDSVTVPIVVEIPTGWIECRCATDDEFCKRGLTDIYYRRVGATTWIEHGTKVTSSTYPTSIEVEVGSYEIKYDMLNIMGTKTKQLPITEGGRIGFSEKMFLKIDAVIVPETPVVYSLTAKVTEVIDGDSFRVDKFEDLPAPSGFPKQQVRIAGYDAFEMEEDYGIYGKTELEKWIKDKTVTLRILRYYPLGRLNRVLASVSIVADGIDDVAMKMLPSCLVKKPEYSEYYKHVPALGGANAWGTISSPGTYRDAWFDPWGEECLTKKDEYGIPFLSIQDITVPDAEGNGSFSIDNRSTRKIAFRAEFLPSRQKSGIIEVMGGSKSTVAYYANSTAIVLRACIEKCSDVKKWVQTDFKSIPLVPKKTVTIECEQDASIYVNGVKVTGGVAYLERLSKTLRKYRT